MTTEKHDTWALLREARDQLVGVQGMGRVTQTIARIDAALAERLDSAQDAVHRQGMDRMQQAVIDLLNEHNAPLHLIARIVEMEYP